MPLASIENVPYLPAALVWATTLLWPASASETVSLPDESNVLSSITAPVDWPVILATSLVPVMVTVISWVAVPPLPSLTVTVMVSVTVWPSTRAWTLALALSSV